MSLGKQQGWSIISLMVGLVVSLLVVLCMLSLFRVISNNAFNPSSGMQPTAAQDRQITTGLLAVQTLLQNAGYGYVPQAMHNTNVVLVSGATKAVNTTPTPALAGNTLAATSTITLTGTAQNIGTGAITPPLSPVSGVNAIFWETAGSAVPATAATATCYGLLSDTDNALYLLQSSGSCSPVSSYWNSVTWSVTPLISSGLLQSGVQFAAQQTNCWPFGAVVGSNAPTGLYVQLGWRSNSTSSLPVSPPGASTTFWSSCLPNVG